MLESDPKFSVFFLISCINKKLALHHLELNTMTRVLSKMMRSHRLMSKYPLVPLLLIISSVVASSFDDDGSPPVLAGITPPQAPLRIAVAEFLPSVLIACARSGAASSSSPFASLSTLKDGSPRERIGVWELDEATDSRGETRRFWKNTQTHQARWADKFTPQLTRRERVHMMAAKKVSSSIDEQRDAAQEQAQENERRLLSLRVRDAANLLGYDDGGDDSHNVSEAHKKPCVRCGSVNKVCVGASGAFLRERSRRTAQAS